jgi:hypothetical protein
MPQPSKKIAAPPSATGNTGGFQPSLTLSATCKTGHRRSEPAPKSCTSCAALEGHGRIGLDDDALSGKTSGVLVERLKPPCEVSSPFDVFRRRKTPFKKRVIPPAPSTMGTGLNFAFGGLEPKSRARRHSGKDTTLRVSGHNPSRRSDFQKSGREIPSLIVYVASDFAQVIDKEI